MNEKKYNKKIEQIKQAILEYKEIYYIEKERLDYILGKTKKITQTEPINKQKLDTYTLEELLIILQILHKQHAKTIGVDISEYYQ